MTTTEPTAGSGPAMPTAKPVPRARRVIATVPMSPAAAGAVPTVPAIVVPAVNPLTQPQQEESDRGGAGQRRVNLIWEATQAAMTVMIVLANVLALFFPVTSQAVQITITNAMFVVLGFYYGRTNHQKIGGVDQGR